MNKKAALISEMIDYYSGDVNRINHFIKVYSYAKVIGEMEQLDEAVQEILEISAIVHDIGIKTSEQKYNSSSGKYQQIEGPPVAKELLEKLNFSESIIARVCFLVGHHHTYQAIDGIDFQILIEADFIVNIHEEAIDQEAVRKIRENYFRTHTGKSYLQKLYFETK